VDDHDLNPDRFIINTPACRHRDDLVPLMEEFGLDVYFSEHMHGYN